MARLRNVTMWEWKVCQQTHSNSSMPKQRQKVDIKKKTVSILKKKHHWKKTDKRKQRKDCHWKKHIRMNRNKSSFQCPKFILMQRFSLSMFYFSVFQVLNNADFFFQCLSSLCFSSVAVQRICTLIGVEAGACWNCFVPGPAILRSTGGPVWSKELLSWTYTYICGGQAAPASRGVLPFPFIIWVQVRRLERQLGH